MMTPDIKALEAKLRLVTKEVSDAARGTAIDIERAQTDVDTGAGTLAQTLDQIAQAEAQEHARHADMLAQLAAQRDAALKQYCAVVFDTSVRMRALRSMLIGSDTPQLQLAGE